MRKRPLKALFFFPGENLTGIAPTWLTVEKDRELAWLFIIVDLKVKPKTRVPASIPVEPSPQLAGEETEDKYAKFVLEQEE